MIAAWRATAGASRPADGGPPLALARCCALLGVSRAGYYAAQRRAAQPSPRAVADAALTAAVRSAFDESQGSYGAPRVQETLRAEGWRVARKRVARLMRAAGLVARPAARARAAPPAAGRLEASAATVPNRLARDFAVATTAAACDRAWVSDMTHLPLARGSGSLAVVLDLGTRRVVGWAVGPAADSALALAAWQQALTTRRPAAGLVHHSDRGPAYCSARYRTALTAAGALVSLSAPGDCWDNAVAESFFATLEWELLSRARWRSLAEARPALFAYIDGWYNTQRRHSSLGYRSPAEYERHLRAA